MRGTDYISGRSDVRMQTNVPMESSAYSDLREAVTNYLKDRGKEIVDNESLPVSQRPPYEIVARDPVMDRLRNMKEVGKEDLPGSLRDMTAEMLMSAADTLDRDSDYSSELHHSVYQIERADEGAIGAGQFEILKFEAYLTPAQISRGEEEDLVEVAEETLDPERERLRQDETRFGKEEVKVERPAVV